MIEPDARSFGKKRDEIHAVAEAGGVEPNKHPLGYQGQCKALQHKDIPNVRSL
jgi:hypothetical protein